MTTPTIKANAAAKKAAANAAAIVCTFCGKPISRTNSIKAQHGARCAFIKAALGNTQAQILHLRKYTSLDNSIKDNKQFVPLANVSRSITANGLTTVSRFVVGFGTDKLAKPPLHVSLTPIYATNRTRYTHKFWLTKKAQIMLATRKFDKVPAAVTNTVTAALALCGKQTVQPK